MIELKGFMTNLGKYNEGSLVGEWVTFPIGEDEQEGIFERIGIDGVNYEEFFFTGWECDIDGVLDELGEYESIDDMNELSEALDCVDDENKLSAVIELDGAQNILDIIENLDDYTFLPNVHDNRDLGHYYADDCGCIEILEKIRAYFDYEAYGRDVAIEAMGTFTALGWIGRV